VISSLDYEWCVLFVLTMLLLLRCRLTTADGLPFATERRRTLKNVQSRQSPRSHTRVAIEALLLLFRDLAVLRRRRWRHSVVAFELWRIE